MPDNKPFPPVMAHHHLPSLQHVCPRLWLNLFYFFHFTFFVCGFNSFIDKWHLLTSTLTTFWRLEKSPLPFHYNQRSLFLLLDLSHGSARWLIIKGDGESNLLLYVYMSIPTTSMPRGPTWVYTPIPALLDILHHLLYRVAAGLPHICICVRLFIW